MNHDHITRPLDILNSWLDHYGYDRIRMSSNSEATLLYALVRERVKGEWKNRWILGGAADDPGTAFKQVFTELLTKYAQDRENELGKDSSKLLGLVALSHGEGKWGIGDPDKGDRLWSDLSDDEQNELRTNDPLFVDRVNNGRCPVRIVNAISETGLIAEITMFYPDQEPQVEIMEQWSEGEGKEMPESRGAIDDALMSTFAFLSVVEAMAHTNSDFSMKGMMDTAVGTAREGDTAMMGFVLRLIASGIENGVVSLEDD